VDLARGNGALLYHVVNRGRFDRRILESDGWSEIADSACGSRERMGRLMQQGFTIAFSGWQADVTGEDDRLQLFVPQVSSNGNPISGEVLAEFEGRAGQKVAYLGANDHKCFPVDSSRQDSAEMREHLSYADPGTLIERQRWSFARLDDKNRPQPDTEHVYFPEGFDTGKTYTVKYSTLGSPAMGLCFPAVRDLVTFFCSADPLNPLLGVSGEPMIRHRLAYGSSQCGRFLRNFLFQGFNQGIDETRVFDGVYSNVPGCRMGFFNYRHAQPSRAWGFYPNFDFPFTDLATTDPISGKTAGLLDKVGHAFIPKIFYIHHSGEYWSSGAALTHVQLEDLQDVEIPDSIRIYSFAGTAHGFAELDQGKPSETPDYLLPFNPNPTYLLENPLLDALADWVISGIEPPSSSFPRADRDELVLFEEFTFPKTPDIDSPRIVEAHPRFDWGPRYEQGILDHPLPKIGELYPVLVPVVGNDGNELGGILSPHVAVPVASYTGWNYPATHYESPSRTQAARLSGAWLPFSATLAERRERGDKRKSLEERYRDLDEYLERLKGACRDLISRRLMFEEDLELVLEQGRAMYQYVSATGCWERATEE
jgi:hypothetical protein